MRIHASTTGRPRRDRRGFALATAIIAIVLIGALMAGAFFSSTQEMRIGRNTLAAQRAFAIAEYGLNYEVSHWDRGRILPGGGSSMAVGQVDSSRRYVADGDTALVRVSRISNNTFWVVSEGGASLGNALVKSTAKTNAMVRIAYPSINVRGAITTGGNVAVGGSSQIYGIDMLDSTRNAYSAMDDLRQWGQCSSFAKINNAGVSVGPTATVSGTNKIMGSPTVVNEAAASDSMTYIKYGSETWNTLKNNADIKLDGGTFGSDIGPVGTATTCDYSVNTNWGEPWRITGGGPGRNSLVAGCRNYFPIIYINSGAQLNGKGRGQGILMVEGDLKINGNFQWYGIIIVKDDIVKGNGTADIFGAVMARNAVVGQKNNDPENTEDWTGNQNVWFSNCAVQSALRGSAILVPVRERAWSQLF